MERRTFAAVVAFAAFTLLASLPAAAQETFRTPWGDPDLQGVWTGSTLTPLERPARFAGQELLTEEQAAELEMRADATRFVEREVREGDPGTYNQIWFDPGLRTVPDRRTALIVDPPDGRYPPLTESARQADRERAAYRREHMYDSYENRSTGDRCIVFGKSGPPIRSGGYNNNLMIFQTADHVVILTEQARQARMIPLEDTEKPAFEQWAGVSRGRWEGETLVVETTQIRDWGNGRNGPSVHLVERLTRLDPDTVAYEYTLTDPERYTAPYTVMMPFRRMEGEIYEYACHEGNIGLYGILAGARRFERDGRELRP